MIEKYLISRSEILNERLMNNKSKLEHNKIAISEANNKIDELKNTIDEAANIFSVKAREDNGFKKQEIINLETKISAYIMDNAEYNNKIIKIEKELEDIHNCLAEIEKINVSRETLDDKEDYINENYNSDENSSNYIHSTSINNYANDEEIIDHNIQYDDEDMKIVVDGVTTNKKTADIINKLKLCKNIIGIDTNRVCLEIDNIIDILKNE